MKDDDFSDEFDFPGLDGQFEYTKRPLKCLDCLMAIDTPAGLWCLKFKGLVNEKMAEQCDDYIGQYLAEKD